MEPNSSGCSPMKVERIVVDTNVLISAALSATGAPARIVAHVLTHYRLVFSQETFDEFDSRLWRPKFDRYLSPGTRRLLLHDFSAVADWVVLPRGSLPTWSRDPDDDKFIHTARAGDPRWLVSGDRDLLDLSTVEGIRILSPNRALQLL